MRSKHSATLIIPALITAVCITSCRMESTMQSSCYAIYVAKSTQGYSTYYVRDDSTMVFNVGSTDPSTSLSNGARVLLTYRYDEAQEGKDPMSMEITGYSEMPRVTAIQTNRPDTLGTDGADLAFYQETYPYLDKVGGIYEAPLMLDLGFQFAGSSTSGHGVAMSYGDSPVDSEGYFHLTFSHKASTGDTLSAYTYQLSITLPDAAHASDVKGVVLKFNGMGTDRTDKYYRFTYATAKTERLN